MLKSRVVAGALGLALVLTLGVFVWTRHAWTPEGEEDPDAVPPESQWETLRAPGSPPSPAPAGIDLLSTLDLGQDAVAGTWGFQRSSLLSGFAPWGRLKLPCSPPSEYDLRLRLTRKRGAGSLGVGIVVEGVQGMIVLDGQESQMSWVVRAGHLGADGNDTARSLRAMKWNKATSLVISVRKGEIVVSLEGVRILHWKGAAGDLALLPEFAVPGPMALILGASNATFRIEEFTLLPITGSPTMLRKA